MRTLHISLWRMNQINEGDHLSAFGHAGVFKENSFSQKI
jgi:hypothetical protein